MHAILSRDDYKDVIDWLPHGKTWNKWADNSEY